MIVGNWPVKPGVQCAAATRSGAFSRLLFQTRSVSCATPSAAAFVDAPRRQERHRDQYLNSCFEGHETATRTSRMRFAVQRRPMLEPRVAKPLRPVFRAACPCRADGGTRQMPCPSFERRSEVTDPEAKPGPRDGSRRLMLVLGGVALGLLVGLLLMWLDIGFGRFGVFPYLIGGGLVGGGFALLTWRRR